MRSIADGDDYQIPSIDDEAIVEEIFRFDKYEIGIYNKNNTNSTNHKSMSRYKINN
jgi:hypothetical protein